MGEPASPDFWDRFCSPHVPGGLRGIPYLRSYVLRAVPYHSVVTFFTCFVNRCLLIGYSNDAAARRHLVGWCALHFWQLQLHSELGESGKTLHLGITTPLVFEEGAWAREHAAKNALPTAGSSERRPLFRSFSFSLPSVEGQV